MVTASYTADDFEGAIVDRFQTWLTIFRQREIRAVRLDSIRLLPIWTNVIVICWSMDPTSCRDWRNRSISNSSECHQDDETEEFNR